MADIIIQSGGLISTFRNVLFKLTLLKILYIFITAFVKIDDPDMDKLRDEFLRNIGGQTHRCFNGKQCNTTTLVFPTSQEESDEEQDIEPDVDDKKDIDPEFEQTVEYAEENENEYAMD
eukprot:10525664-Ditylum_brightwellii.AAC.1